MITVELLNRVDGMATEESIQQASRNGEAAFHADGFDVSKNPYYQNTPHFFGWLSGHFMSKARSLIEVTDKGEC